MSRGGGGGRGGRGGRRGGGPQLPWENEEFDARPSELFPAYDPPTAKPLTPTERRTVESFLLLRRQLHDGPLYTSRKLPGPTSVSPSSASYRGKRSAASSTTYDPIRSSRAVADPFTAVPTYSQRFARAERTLPDFSSRPYCPEFVPDELHATFEGRDAERGVISAAAFRGRKTKKRLQLSRITALPTAEDVFGVSSSGADADGRGLWEDEDEAAAAAVGGDPTVRTKMTLEALQRLEEEPAAGEGEEVEEEEENAAEEDQDLEYDDEDAGDYDAENYFDGGDDYDDDVGDDDQGDAF
ncbi:III, C31 subunit of DNA-directed RNA polymerase [Sodiomyces alkalinus F11]|uniref:DNA-directed RNA polymerase III subunit n=1 Tax=Sodiomyces alkalinus (strain CBS 110278 / VKM F-3762 / F11) TaxID=1314773 RepID=A0A3N2Q5A8_SODAK|nr:III, C31 subunit of DNA-directed RNA polymerase [Sodiomyces alkalinus F11]ROT41960.1 III, C31 subunit of DNA-directed RNA polymerase [Sodiomyces alkalinus F11]